jgi:hypothetical protein
VLVRKQRESLDVPVHYLGFEIPDVWVVGYGLDFADKYRTLPYIAEIKADNILLAQREVNSPDVVDGTGRLPTTDPIGPICDAGVMQVGLADAVFHSPFFKSGNYEKCSDLSAPYGTTIEVGDAVIGTVYIKSGASAACFIGCP